LQELETKINQTKTKEKTVFVSASPRNAQAWTKK